MDREFLHNKYYTNLHRKGFPDRWMSGALWVNSQYTEMAKNFKQQGWMPYTIEDLQEAITVGWNNYKEEKQKNMIV